MLGKSIVLRELDQAGKHYACIEPLTALSSNVAFGLGGFLREQMMILRLATFLRMSDTLEASMLFDTFRHKTLSTGATLN